MVVEWEVEFDTHIAPEEMTMKKTTKRTPKRKPAPAPVVSTLSPEPEATPRQLSPESMPVAPPLVNECALCESPAAKGSTLCPACEETDTAGRNALALGGGLTLRFDSESRPTSITKTAAPLQRWPAPVAGEAMKIGTEVARYLKIHQRRPYVKPEDVEWMINRARAAWHAVLIETASVEVQSEEGAL
jgi:hypothetical protein